MAGSTVLSENAAPARPAGPRQFDLDRCVHCGLCLDACPTYRELGLETDSPRGRIRLMAEVSEGAPMTPGYLEHIGLCLACRGCETACPSGVRYGRMLEDARERIETKGSRGRLAGWARKLFFDRVLQSRAHMTLAGTALYLFEASGMKALMRAVASLKLLGVVGDLVQVAPSIDPPFFFSQIGKTFPAQGERQHRVAFLAGCLANFAFARLNEATVRVLQKNGCEVVVPSGQGCCGALHLHAGLREGARALARRNVDALLGGEYDAIITNAGGCGTTLKEYGELLADDPAYAARAREVAGRVRDVTEFLASIELNPAMKRLDAVVTYQDSCHLAHAQHIRSAPRRLLTSVPGVTLEELRGADECCGSAGIYNAVHSGMAMRVLKSKMEAVNATGASIVASSNPGCMLQLQAGVRLHGTGQKVMHVVEILDQAYRKEPAGRR
ncbi:MAG TPA: heterodisulfide reductase-related iron-sulfur binding cluster [Bryobacteraceae bacterium]|nr:heterodisulfide reductase-related iron-sulfur binding cluster [Bryobacteraceae bacterium]